jgi:GntR family transcriptional regulator of arabinose operon/LacI family transcriptional regulator
MASGHLRPGDLLPPEVNLAQQMGVARNTVRQAMRELELQRVIRRVRGKGTIVCELTPESTNTRQTVGQLYGLVLPELRAGMYQSLQAGLNNSMAAISANMIVCDSGQDLYQQVDALLQLAHRGVSGVALVPVTVAKTPAHHVSFLRRNKLPFVFCHRRIEGIRAPLVGFSGFDMGHAAAAELARHGHRRVAAIFSHVSDSAEERKRGIQTAMQEAGGVVPEEFIYFDNTLRSDPLPPGLEERLIEQLKRMLAHPQPPTAFIVSADKLAGMVCLALQKLGRVVPRDVSVIGFGDRSNRDMIFPVRLQSVTVDEWKLGQIAFETLSQIQRGERAPDDNEDILMPLDISEGDSIAKPRSRR